MSDFIPDDAKVPLLVAVGGVLVKVGEYLLKRKAGSISDEQRFRGDLGKDNDRLRKALDESEREANEWRKKYWDEIGRGGKGQEGVP